MDSLVAETEQTDKQSSGSNGVTDKKFRWILIYKNTIESIYTENHGIEF